MGYNLKNARNAKSASKITKWPSLRLLELKSKFTQHFKFSENLEDLHVWKMLLESNGLALQQAFPYCKMCINTQFTVKESSNTQ